MNHQNKRLTGIMLTAAFLLLIPFIAMQFTGDANWSLSDFVKAGILLFGSGILCEIVLRKFKKPGQRIAICATILAVFFIIWAELAVGIFGTPFAGN